MELVSLSTVIDIEDDAVNALFMDLSLFKLVILEEILPGLPRDEIMNAIVSDAVKLVNDQEPDALNDLLSMYIEEESSASDQVIEHFNEWFAPQHHGTGAIRYGEALRDLLIDELPLEDPTFDYKGCVISPDNLDACTLYYTINTTDDEDIIDGDETSEV